MRLISRFLSFAVCAILPILAGAKDYRTIRNDAFKLTVAGKPIYSQGGGIFRFTDPRDGVEKYFWYGVHYKEAELYAANPVQKYARNTFVGISLYTSTDLTSWTEETEVMTVDDLLKDSGRRFAGWVGRMGVAYIEETGDYGLYVQHNNSVLVARSDSPLGPFKPYRHIDMTSRIGTPNTGDQTVFTDPDTGKSYLVYSYGKGRHKTYISELGIESQTDSLGLKNCEMVFSGAGREGNCMFKRGGRYYIYASNLYGWDSSYAYYLVADNIYGPYRPAGTEMAVTPGCEKDYAHISQTGFFYTLRAGDRETVIYCGDRWTDFAHNGLGYNQWVPMEFDSDGTPNFVSLSEWQLDHATGDWRVGHGNNYVLNGSFDADRRIIPLANKPRQEFLLGWDTEVLRGNKVGVGLPDSPQLNRENSPEDNAHVTGKLALNISDNVAFERRVSQLVEDSRYIPLKDGKYILSATVKVSGSFSRLELFGGKDAKDLKGLGSDWQRVSVPVTVKGGSIRVGIYAKGSAGASCCVDDITLVSK